MTTIVVRDGVIAADSRATIEHESGGHRVTKCQKLYRKQISKREEVIIATAGESYPALVFVDWYGSGKEPPEMLIHGEADVDILVLTRHGVFEYDKWCRGEKLKGPFHVAGSGAKAALGALHMGASATAAVRIACKIDPYSAPPIITMRLK